MGPKITIDSASLMNKALEVIEAHHLFATPVDQIEVMVHPQSIVHSMVAYEDGSLMAQLGEPDMRTPIQYALTWPHHVKGPVNCPDLLRIGSLNFEAPDRTRFPSLDLGSRARPGGGAAPAIFNAANEAAVERFLGEHIRFIDIFALIEQTLDHFSDYAAVHNLEDIVAADQAARQWAAEATPR